MIRLAYHNQALSTHKRWTLTAAFDTSPSRTYHTRNIGFSSHLACLNRCRDCFRDDVSLQGIYKSLLFHRDKRPGRIAAPISLVLNIKSHF